MTAIFDTHAHYDDDAFNEDREQLLAALPGQGIARVVDVGASLASCRKVLELMEQYDYIYGAIGVHPSETAELDEESYSWLKEQCRKKKCLAVPSLNRIGLFLTGPLPPISPGTSSCGSEKVCPSSSLSIYQVTHSEISLPTL